MAAMRTDEYTLKVEGLPLAWLAKSHDGHLLEIDVNMYKGVAFVRFPNHIPTLHLVREVFCAMSDSCMLDDLLDSPECMPERQYGGVVEGSKLVMGCDEQGLYVEMPDGEKVRNA